MYVTRDEFNCFMHDILDMLELLRKDLKEWREEEHRSYLEALELQRRVQESAARQKSKNPRTAA